MISYKHRRHFNEPPTCPGVSTICLSKRNVIKTLDKNYASSIHVRRVLSRVRDLHVLDTET